LRCTVSTRDEHAAGGEIQFAWSALWFVERSGWLDVSGGQNERSEPEEARDQSESSAVSSANRALDAASLWGVYAGEDSRRPAGDRIHGQTDHAAAVMEDTGSQGYLYRGHEFPLEHRWQNRRKRRSVH